MTTTKVRKASTLSSSVWGIVLAGGRPSQFGSDIDPVFLSLGSKPVLTYCLAAIERCSDLEGIAVVAPKERVDSVRTMISMFGCTKVKAIVAAPPAREAAVSAGLQALADQNPGFIAVLDGAIPGVSSEMISEAVKTARKHGIAAVARPVGVPVCESARGTKITKVLDADSVWVLLGPQVFRKSYLEKALAIAAKKKIRGADEASLAMAAKLDVHLVPVRNFLIRIASPQDLSLADYLLRR